MDFFFGQTSKEIEIITKDYIKLDIIIQLKQKDKMDFFV